MATGEGGMITTNSDDLHDKAKIMRYHGVTRAIGQLEGVDYGVDAHYPSQNFRMTETSAIIGLSQLSHLDEFVEKRNWIASKYTEKLSEVDGVNLLPTNKFSVSSYWNYYFILDSDIDRNKLSHHLHKNGVENANAYYPACHHHSIYKDYVLENYPISDDILKRHLSLPMYYELTQEDINEITDIVISGVMSLR
jgi:dTDP-4-amino-4,6-dideoxygalactose transaminase